MSTSEIACSCLSSRAHTLLSLVGCNGSHALIGCWLLQAMGENVAAAAAEFCRVLSMPGASEAPMAAPGVFFDVLGVRMARYSLSLSHLSVCHTNDPWSVLLS